jgi:hypothetical protein
MWICFSDAFVSIVQDRDNPNRLMVRARARKHLAALFPTATVIETLAADYRWRVIVSRDQVTKLLADRIADLTYTNFKHTVSDRRLHDLYLNWWSDHRRLQEEDEAAQEGAR